MNANGFAIHILRFFLLETFAHTYQDLLPELQELNLADRARALGLEIRSDRIVLPFFGRPHFISHPGVVDSDGNSPTPAVVTILLNNFLRNSGIPPSNPAIISFRDFNGAAPLVVSFANNTNHLIAAPLPVDSRSLNPPAGTLAASRRPMPRPPICS